MTSNSADALAVPQGLDGVAGDNDLSDDTSGNWRPSDRDQPMPMRPGRGPRRQLRSSRERAIVGIIDRQHLDRGQPSPRAAASANANGRTMSASGQVVDADQNAPASMAGALTGAGHRHRAMARAATALEVDPAVIRPRTVRSRRCSTINSAVDD